MYVLYQQDLHVALEKGKSKDMLEGGCQRINHVTSGTIRFCLMEDRKCFVTREVKVKDL